MESIDSIMDELNRVSDIRDKVYKKTMQIRDLIEDIDTLVEPLLDDWDLRIVINQVPAEADWEEFCEDIAIDCFVEPIEAAVDDIVEMLGQQLEQEREDKGM